MRLRSARVGIAGVGGLGSHVAVALARSGVGCLVLADFDRVETGNLARQYYFIDQVGEPKVAALAATLKRINPETRVETHCRRLQAADLPGVFSGVEVMVEAFDRADQKALLVSSFLSRCPEIPLVAASGAAGWEPAGMIRTRRAAKNLYLCGDEASAVGPATPLCAARVGIVAHHQALAVVRLLLGLEP
jgi:sulfur carrier protein ThiS adenylyltransferase